MDFKIFDLHNDILTGCDYVLSQLNFYKKTKNKIITAYFKGENSFNNAYKELTYFTSILPNNCLLAMEDIGYDSLNNIVKMLNFNPLYVSLTWNKENVLGYGCNYYKEDIKQLGLKVIKNANERGIPIDTAHISNKGFYTIIDKAKFVLCSHTAFNSVYNHKRNITDEQIKLIIEKGGVIGLCLYSDFISKSNANVQKWVKHLDFFVNKFGFNNICIGSDFFGAKNFIKNINNYQNFSKIVEILIKMGYNVKVINKIFFGNAQKYINYILSNR